MKSDENVLLSFEVEKNKKHVLIYENNTALNYALLRPDESIEFYFPKPYYDEGIQETIYQELIYDVKQQNLKFSNEDAIYEIYETDKIIGIKVQTEGKIYDLKCIKNTQKGSLTKIGNGFINLKKK